jgi:hypothetical protein
MTKQPSQRSIRFEEALMEILKAVEKKQSQKPEKKTRRQPRRKTLSRAK